MMTTAPERKLAKYKVETNGIVTELIRQTPRTQTLRLKAPNLPPEKAPFRFKPGQFVMVRPFIESRNKIIPRSYSISSSPTRSMKTDGYFDLTVFQTQTPTVSKWMNDRNIGDEVPFRGPYGSFVWNSNDPSCEQLFMLAGGSGITPMKSILEFIHDKNLPNKATLLYSCRTQEDIFYKKELPQLIEKSRNIKLIITLTREPNDSNWNGRKDRFGLEDIKSALKTNDYDLKKTTFYICGTPGFIAGMIQNLDNLGIKPSRIKREKWD
ncbi:MAG: FAD-binding oxidoreductase [Candidatus Hodarchaeota archaeon]